MPKNYRPVVILSVVLSVIVAVSLVVKFYSGAAVTAPGGNATAYVSHKAPEHINTKAKTDMAGSAIVDFLSFLENSVIVKIIILGMFLSSLFFILRGEILIGMFTILFIIIFLFILPPILLKPFKSSQSVLQKPKPIIKIHRRHA